MRLSGHIMMVACSRNYVLGRLQTGQDRDGKPERIRTRGPGESVVTSRWLHGVRSRHAISLLH